MIAAIGQIQRASRRSLIGPRPSPRVGVFRSGWGWREQVGVRVQRRRLPVGPGQRPRAQGGGRVGQQVGARQRAERLPAQPELVAQRVPVAVEVLRRAGQPDQGVHEVLPHRPPGGQRAVRDLGVEQRQHVRGQAVAHRLGGRERRGQVPDQLRQVAEGRAQRGHRASSPDGAARRSSSPITVASGGTPGAPRAARAPPRGPRARAWAAPGPASAAPAGVTRRT